MRRHRIPRAWRRMLAPVGGERGFSLIELLVTMGILLIVMGAITGTLVSASNQEANLNHQAQSQTQARQALTKLTREIHCASEIQDSGGTPMSSWTGSVSGITLTLPAGCPTGGADAVTAKWCTVADGSTWDLYRLAATVSDPTCPGTGGVRWAQYLTTDTPFSTVSGSFPSIHFPLVHVDLTVNSDTTTKKSLSDYALSSDVAALNAEERS